jgi:mRNA interferase RelE/StbE
MSTIVINVDDKSSAKLFLDLAKKLRFKARILTDQQKEDWALLAMMEARDKEPALPVESALDILRGIKSK